MNIIKERAVWIVILLIILGGISYMLVVDPERVNQMDNIVERDDTRIGDITEVKELYNRLDLKLNGTKQHLKNLYDTTVTHMNVYNAKVDSINNTFSKLDLKLDQLKEFIKTQFEDMSDEMEDLSDDLSGLKTQTNKKLRELNQKINSISEDLDKIDMEDFIKDYKKKE
tara:strand:- start:162 stop:668 length:507 start_codon:yes stop_codon:yes gene_type:complete